MEGPDVNVLLEGPDVFLVCFFICDFFFSGLDGTFFVRWSVSGFIFVLFGFSLRRLCGFGTNDLAVAHNSEFRVSNVVRRFFFFFVVRAAAP